MSGPVFVHQPAKPAVYKPVFVETLVSPAVPETFTLTLTKAQAAFVMRCIGQTTDATLPGSYKLYSPLAQHFKAGEQEHIGGRLGLATSEAIRQMAEGCTKWADQPASTPNKDPL